ncbi:MAG TPA: aspartyl protease family protein [Terriglobales bacterium]|nr:aspartyl protease family protein [Terriglobales bacterium]
MRTRTVLLFFVFLAALTSVCLAETAQEILGKSKDAMGGAAWDSIRTTHSTAKIVTSGLSGDAESWEDNLDGHYVDRFKLGPSSGAEGFDGTTVWSQDSSGQSRVEGAAAARQAAMNEAYRRCFAYWYPQRWAAQIEYSGEKEDQGKRFHVIRITPQGGRPFDLWIDATTYLFDHIVEKADIETRTDYFSDYRTVDGVKVPFSGRSTNGDTKYDQLITLEKIDFNAPVQEAMFRMPAPPPPDFSIAGGKTSTVVPFELINNHIYVQVKLNDKGPFRLLCDTGGANIISPEAAKELGLKTEGALQGRGVGEKSEDVGLTKIQTLQLGDATLNNQLFAVFPMESFASVEGVKEQGLIGYEVFKRFIVKVDYEHHNLTLTVPSAFTYQGNGTKIPFVFNAHIPQVDGAIDGLTGKFDIDTGSRSSLDLLKPFVEKHDLVAKYGAKLEAVTGWGVGGASRSLVTRSKVLQLGTNRASVEVHNPVTELSLQSKGAFTSPYYAGNVGGGVLKRFNITFDYTHQQLIFEPNANYNKPDVFDRSGMWLNQVDGTFEVMDVVAGGPAAQVGIKVGDKVVAVDGRPSSQILLPDLRIKFKTEAPGTKLRLTVNSGGQQRDVELTLRDLV